MQNKIYYIEEENSTIVQRLVTIPAGFDCVFFLNVFYEKPLNTQLIVIVKSSIQQKNLFEGQKENK